VLCRASERAVERLSHAEIQSLALQMILIPNNLTTHFLGEVAAHVLSNPRLRAELRARDSAAHEVIDDILLSRPPGLILARGAAIASMQAEAVAQELSREEGLRITADGFQRDSDGSSTVLGSHGSSPTNSLTIGEALCLTVT
jgi:cytochrome P450